jgi:O-acetylserine dependent cystathionine beta-synthase
MIELRRLRHAGQSSVFAKLEIFNPGGSIKDRIALGMVEKAERNGLLREGGTIIEPTAGNTGIGLALIGSQRGYRVIMVVPEHFAEEKVQVMEVLGAEVVRTPSDAGMKEAIRTAREMERTIPGAYCPDQFSNPANPEVHYRTTGPEIWEQMGERVDAVCIGAGTGGTMTGVARFLREKNPAVHVALVEPQGSVFGGGEAGDHDVEGIGNSFVPDTTEMDLVDEVMTVDDGEAFAVVDRLARVEGILAGSSGGAAVAAAFRLAERLGERGRIATVIPDGYERYMTKYMSRKGKKE